MARVCETLFKASSNIDEAFSMFDVNGDGCIAYEEFMSVMQTLDLGLSDLQIFELMRSMDSNQDSHIDASEFRSRFTVEFDRLASIGEEGDWQADSLRLIGRTILTHQVSLPATFAKFDSSGCGGLSPEEFRGVLKELQLQFTDAQCDQLFEAVDVNGSGRISYVEFVGAFKVKDNGAEGAHDWQDGILQQVGNMFYQHRIHLKSVFRMFDIDNDGKISCEEFRNGLTAINGLLDSPLSPAQVSLHYSPLSICSYALASISVIMFLTTAYPFCLLLCAWAV